MILVTVAWAKISILLVGEETVAYLNHQEDVFSLKEDTFEQIYEAFGREIEPEDLEHVLVVTNAKFHQMDYMWFC